MVYGSDWCKKPSVSFCLQMIFENAVPRLITLAISNDYLSPGLIVCRLESKKIHQHLMVSPRPKTILDFDSWVELSHGYHELESRQFPHLGYLPHRPVARDLQGPVQTKVSVARPRLPPQTSQFSFLHLSENLFDLFRPHLVQFSSEPSIRLHVSRIYHRSCRLILYGMYARSRADVF